METYFLLESLTEQIQSGELLACTTTTTSSSTTTTSKDRSHLAPNQFLIIFFFLLKSYLCFPSTRTEHMQHKAEHHHTSKLQKQGKTNNASLKKRSVLTMLMMAGVWSPLVVVTNSNKCIQILLLWRMNELAKRGKEHQHSRLEREDREE